MTAVIEDRAAMSSADQNDLPDSAFAYIEPGGSKDSEGKTTPRSLRHFPIHDKAHADNAAARIAQGAKFGAQALPKVKAAQKKFGEPETKSQRDPDFELRKRRRMSMAGQLERRRMPFARGSIELRAKPDGTGGTNYEFEGYGAVFDAPFDMWDRWGDEYTEIVRPGAFSQTLSRKGLDVPFLVGHNDAGIPLARTRSGTMELRQDPHGLHVRAQMDGRSSQARDLAVAVERGDLDEMSIGFITMPGGHAWSDDVMTREMLNLDLHRGDVSAVALAANPATAGASMVALPTETLSRRPGERRAQGEIEDTSTRPDFNVPDQDPSFDGKGAHPCPHGMKNGCAEMVPGSAKFCPNCGGPQYQGDGELVVDDSGVVTEEGNKGDASLLALRLRLLELA